MKSLKHKNTRMQELHKKLIKASASKNFLNFIKYVKPNYKVNWHHKAMADILEKFSRGEIPRLIINIPPRHGKSEQVSRNLPAYILGKNPNARIIAASYSKSLASRMNRDVQRVIDSDKYRDIFKDTHLMGPGMNIKPTREWVRNNNGFEVAEKQGVYLSVGRGSGVTGEGADFIIVDDPIKDAQEANSQTIRDSLWEWWTSTLSTRGEETNGKDCGILVTMTRWHHDDLVGRLLKLEKENPDADHWEVFSLPAVREDGDRHESDEREEGEALWPEKRNEKALNNLKASLGTRVFNAMFQQRPTSGTGEIIKRSWFKFYKVLPEGIRLFVQSWDLSFDEGEKNDYVVGQLWGVLGPNYYLIAQIRDKMGFTVQISSIKGMSSRYPKSLTKLVEKKANGAAVLDVLRKDIPGLIAVEPTKSKVIRVEAVSPLIEGGNVHLPDSSIAPWIQEYVEEFVSFPKGAHDDQVDSTSQFLLWMQNKNSSEYSQEMVQNRGTTLIDRGDW